jgi:hypothetical protein
LDSKSIAFELPQSNPRSEVQCSVDNKENSKMLTHILIFFYNADKASIFPSDNISFTFLGIFCSFSALNLENYENLEEIVNI